MRKFGISLTLAIIAILAISGLASAARGRGDWDEHHSGASAGSYGRVAAPGGSYEPAAPGGNYDPLGAGGYYDHGFQDADQDGICDACGEYDHNNDRYNEHNDLDLDGDGVCDHDGNGDGVCEYDGAEYLYNSDSNPYWRGYRPSSDHGHYR